MKVTVCELNEDPSRLSQEWEALVAHVREQASQLVLLPEMPFSPWFARSLPFDQAAWQAAIHAHESWLPRLAELAPAMVLSSRPVEVDGRRLNEGFAWDSQSGYRATHTKYFLPDEEGFWEASWYQRGEADFNLLQVGSLRVGFLICTELWFLEHARRYGQAGAHLIVTPRATELPTVEKWLTGGRVAAIVSGAYSLSSNRVNQPGDKPALGGQGWVVGPDGDVLGLTSRQQPFVTLELDLQAAEQAKQTYPRYVQA